jgi:hypothetical protein
MDRRKNRLPRRFAGLLCARMPELQLHRVGEPRRQHQVTWRLDKLLGALVVAMCAGCRSLAEVEQWSLLLAPAARRLLGIPRRLADTTARDVLIRLKPASLRQALHRQIKAARRRKALRPEGLPLSVVTMDGKATAVTASGGRYLQKKDDGVHLVRTVSATLTSARAKPCIDAIPIPAHTNEAGWFQHALGSLLATYGTKLFQVVDYDAGATSLANATYVADKGLEYFFRLKANQPTLYQEATRLLATAPVLARTVDVPDNRTRVIREVSVSGEMAGFLDWGHLSSVIRVRKQTTVDEVVTEDSDRYWLSSLTPDALSPEQWLLMVRNHWAVENETHNTLDVPLCEDTKPWVTADTNGFLAVLLLRRIAYNLLAFFRRVTLRSEENRLCPWKALLRQFDHMSKVISAADVENLRNQGRVYTCV